MLAVLLLISILGSVSFSVGAQTLDNYRLEKAAKQLVSDLRETREKAIAENVWQQIKFYPSSNMYRILKAGVRVEDVTLDKGVTLKSGYLDISFYPTGVPSVGATIILGNNRGKELKVIIAPVTGRVRISS